MYTSGAFAKMIGVNLRTLVRWHNSGKLMPAQITSNNRRGYSHEQYQNYMKTKFNIDVK
jgi:DNA-binding transcriptional MerR regulator